MNKVFTIALILLVADASAQGLLMRSTIICDSAHVPAIRSAVQTFKPIWDQLANEHWITNWEYSDEAKGNRLTLTYTFAVESEAKLPAAHAEYLKRAEKQFPVQYRTYQETCKAPKDTVRRRGVIFPVIHDNGAFVFQVKGIDESPDPKLNYDVVFDFTSFAELKEDVVDSSKINWGLQQIGRVLNLHVASGIPLNKIHFVVAIHGRAVKTFLNEQAYQAAYHSNNPNAPLIRELARAGVKFLMCGQITTFMKVDKSMLLPEVKLALTAQTVITGYQARGYSLMNIEND
jgi:intracellular sulfur oxidation DsrE/DsrF family protein